MDRGDWVKVGKFEDGRKWNGGKFISKVGGMNVTR